MLQKMMVTTARLFGFNPAVYRSLYLDLLQNNFTEKEAENYWITKGIYEGKMHFNRPSPKNIPMSQKKYKWNVAVMTAFKDCAPFLREWIEFHIMIGVEHFILFNNQSSDNYLEILQPYIDKKIVELHNWEYPWNKTAAQRDIYREGLRKMRGYAKWVAIIDSDEFLMPTKNENINDVLCDFESYPAIVVNWTMFGIVDEFDFKNDLLIEKSTLRPKDDFPDNCNVKSIVRPEYVARVDCVHYMTYMQGLFAVDTKKRSVLFHNNPYPAYDRLRLNHYFFRTREDFKKKIKQKKADDVSLHHYLADPDDEIWSEQVDTSALKYIPELHKRLSK